MAKKKANVPLNIYINGLFVGSLDFRAKRDLIFSYSDKWLSRSQAFPISRVMPLREQAYSGNRVYSYFDNLLPDNISIRQRVAARMKAESDHVFDLLSVIGRDCVGALQFVKNDEEPPTLSQAVGQEVSEKEIAEKLRGLERAPLAVSQEDDIRLSIAGMQEKTALLLKGTQWCVPHGPTPTTHIFKPQIGELQRGLNFLDSVENEWLCSKIVAAFGIPVANSEIKNFEEIKVLVVERFDRAWINSSTLIRIPQEDMCQALNVESFAKYQNDGGPGVVQIMEMLNESNERERDRRLFLKAQVVFLLLAAIDGHAKNFSLRWGPGGFQMTALYDILSAQPLIDRKEFQADKIKMAMSYGDKNNYRVCDIYRRHFLQTAAQCRYSVNEMEMIIDEVIAEAPEVLTKVSRELPADFPLEVAESILRGIEKRLPQIQV